VAKPIPLVAPVITMTCSFSRFSLIFMAPPEWFLALASPGKRSAWQTRTLRVTPEVEFSPIEGDLGAG
jgi:hypothetical protein